MWEEVSKQKTTLETLLLIPLRPVVLKTAIELVICSIGSLFRQQNSPLETGESLS